MKTTQIGDIAEAAVVLKLLQRPNITLMRPVNSGCRFDLGMVSGGVFYRLQVKSGRLRHGAVTFNTRSQVSSTSGTINYKGYEGEADLLVVWCPELDSLYLVPIEQLPSAVGSLRVEPTKNKQQNKLRWAKDYLLS